MTRAALVLAALTLASGGCARQEAPAAASAPRSGAPAAPRALIVSATLRLQVEDVDAAAATVRSKAIEAGGFVSDGNLSGTGADRSGHFQLRIPATRLADVRATLGSLGSVIDDSEQVEDVTAQSIDLKARVRNARVQEHRLLELVEQRTATLGDLLALEKELAAIRETIERLEAQDRAFDHQVELATLQVFLSRPRPAAWSTPVASLGAAARGGLEACAGVLVGLGMVVAATAPTLLSLALLALMTWRLGRPILRRVRRPAAR